MSGSQAAHHPFVWLIAGLVVASVIFALRLIVKAQRRDRLERAASAVEQETIETPPGIG